MNRAGAVHLYPHGPDAKTYCLGTILEQRRAARMRTESLWIIHIRMVPTPALPVCNGSASSGALVCTDEQRLLTGLVSIRAAVNETARLHTTPLLNATL